MERELAELQSRIEPLERFVISISKSLTLPLFYDSAQNHTGFRYGRPDYRHFCLLKGMRAVSGLNAALQLVRTGYVQELYVMLRAVVEHKSHIEFVLYALSEHLVLQNDVTEYVETYFADFRRNSAEDYKRPKLRQGAVHKAVGAKMCADTQNGPEAKKFESVVPERLLSNIYLNFSNYVHARYPEVMDMFGGEPLKIHLRGMSRTPKDQEMFLMLESSIETVSLILKLWAQKMKLKDIIENDPKLKAWYGLRI